jgi:prepilin-type N-terminal cleavage/methylation domain-containing protein
MQTKRAGFTLVEILVVISIIAILLTVGSFSYGEVRENARDAKRISDIEQIGLALRLYEQEYGQVPACVNGTVLEVGRTGGMYTGSNCADELLLKQYLTDYFGEIPIDPAGPGDDDYYYYYDAQHNCFFGRVSAAMVFAVNLENKESNAASTCAGVTGNDGGYLNTVGINPSQPYVYLIK